MHIPLSGHEPVVLSLPPSLAPETLGELEHALSAGLRALQRETRGAAADPGQTEYASWLPQSDTVRH
jgi:hypothetical protein